MDVERVGHGFRNLDNDRLRLLQHRTGRTRSWCGASRSSETAWSTTSMSVTGSTFSATPGPTRWRPRRSVSLRGTPTSATRPASQVRRAGNRPCARPALPPAHQARPGILRQRQRNGRTITISSIVVLVLEATGGPTRTRLPRAGFVQPAGRNLCARWVPGAGGPGSPRGGWATNGAELLAHGSVCGGVVVPTAGRFTPVS